MIARSDGQRSNGRRGVLLIKHGLPIGSAGVGEKIKSSAPAAVGSVDFGSPLTPVVKPRSRHKAQGAIREIFRIGYCVTLPLPFNWNVLNRGTSIVIVDPAWTPRSILPSACAASPLFSH